METNYTKPNEEELAEIYKADSEDESKCQNQNEWTPWNSLRSPENNNGDDYESLQDHIQHSSFT